ncbi:MAG: M48 family metallopeptidase [Phycisphaerales bacterium]|nr:M48 family metallopeptidase [Phycisphaerales bacterium]
MAMNFFEHQDQARRRTGRLVMYFAIAVLCIIAALYATGMVLLNWAEQSTSGSSQNQAQVQPEILYWNWEVFLGVVCLSGLIIGGGSLYRIHQLSGGGSVVAESLGGTLLDPGSVDGDERKLLNIVEEMAIASGVPVPPVYVIEDDTINAFAAGFKPTDAVIGVTRGCMRQLDRDQLQGVIAHEFSHIFNGDMRLNIRLIGVIHGLLVMGLIGLYILRSMAISGGGRRSSGNKKDNGVVFVIIIAAVMMLLGFVGTFFGRLIQASVSRQREFLADASAVQYTRNPEGIAGALRAIGGLSDKSSMGPQAGEYNHMFFAQAMNSVFASHPPVQERVARIEQVPVDSLDGSMSSASAAAFAPGASGFVGGVSTAQLNHAVDAIGTIDAHAVSQASQVLGSLPDNLVDAAHETWSARLVVLGLLLDPDAQSRARQLKIIAANMDEAHHDSLNVLVASTSALHPFQKLPLLDMCIPSLSRLSKPQYDAYMEVVKKVIKADGHISLLEWTVYTVLEKHLGERFDPASKKRPGTRSMRTQSSEVRKILATAAYLGQEHLADVQSAYAAGLKAIKLEGTLPDQSACTLRNLRHSLQKLSVLRYADRQKVIKAVGVCIDHDGHTSVDEAMLLRGIADSIDCPMPPLMPEDAAA